MAEPIGILIKTLLQKDGIVLRRFGEHMGLSERATNYFFKKKDISFSQVIRASEYLGIDLTQFYMPAKLRTKEKDTFKVLLEITGGEEKKESLPIFLNKLKQLVKENGYEIS